MCPGSDPASDSETGGEARGTEAVGVCVHKEGRQHPQKGQYPVGGQGPRPSAHLVTRVPVARRSYLLIQRGRVAAARRGRGLRRGQGPAPRYKQGPGPGWTQDRR